MFPEPANASGFESHDEFVFRPQPAKFNPVAASEFVRPEKGNVRRENLEKSTCLRYSVQKFTIPSLVRYNFALITEIMSNFLLFSTSSIFVLEFVSFHRDCLIDRIPSESIVEIIGVTREPDDGLVLSATFALCVRLSCNTSAQPDFTGGVQAESRRPCVTRGRSTATLVHLHYEPPRPTKTKWSNDRTARRSRP